MTTPVELKCPKCGALLAMEDVNMATDGFMPRLQ